MPTVLSLFGYRFWFYGNDHTPIHIHIKKGDAIGQGVFAKYLITDEDNATGDRTGGFGSTDK